MNNIAISQISLGDIPFEESISLISKHNIDKVGLFYYKIKDEDPKEIKKICDRYKITPISLAAAGINATSYTGWVEDVTKAIKIANYLEIKDLIVIASRMGCSTPQTSKLHLNKAMFEILPYLKKYNVKLIFEPLHPIFSDMSVFCRFSETYDFISEYPADYVGIAFDYFHCWWDEQAIDTLNKCKDYLASVHISDWGKFDNNRVDRVILGDGIIPIHSLTNKIKDVGYAGVFEIEIINESYSSNKLMELINQDIEILNDIFIS